MQFESGAVSWTRYWRAGNLNTCFTGNQTFSLHEKWSQWFGKLEAGMQIIDLATGNGAVARIAAETLNRQDKDFSIFAVDQANIEPQLFMQGFTAPTDNIKLTPNTYIEDLPFEAGCFDCVCSQFGFEYSDTTKAINEIARVCAKGAVLKFIIHAHNGEVDKASRNRLARVKSLIAKGNVMELALRISKLRMQGNSGAAQERTLLHKLQGKIDKWRSRLSEVQPDDVAASAIQHLIALMQDTELAKSGELNASLREMSKELHAYIVRLNSMIHAARTEEEITMISKGFSDAGFASLKHEPLLDANGIVAWDLSAIRND